jgi:zinc/manganese transport system substrate-binding protein
LHRRTLLLSLPAPWLGGRQAGAATALPVVASFSILADLARQVGGPAVAVTSLVPPDGDVHAYEPRPSDLRTLKGARLVVVNGLGLEGWTDRLLAASGTAAPVVTASAGVTPRILGESGHGGAGATDPHAWQDPRNGLIYVRNIADGLAAVAPADAAALRGRAEDTARRIAETDAWIARQVATVPPEKRRILTSHDAFGYFGARYGIEFRGIEGIDTEAEPSAAAIAALIGQIRAEGIKAVFVETMTSPRLARMVARESGAVLGPTVYSDALSPQGGPADTYLKMFRHNVPLFVSAMLAN